MNTAHINKKDAFNQWKNWCEILRIKESLTAEKKKTMIETLNQLLGNSASSKLRIVLAKFNENARIDSIQDAFFRKLMSTKSGTFLSSFDKWKTIPDRTDNQQYKLASKFERNLARLIQNNLKSSFDPLKDINYDGLAMKRQCVRKLFEKAMGTPKRLFLHWSTLTKNHKQVNACKMVSFYNLSFRLLTFSLRSRTSFKIMQHPSQ